MGIRIHKAIGYYISKQNSKTLFQVPTQKILDILDDHYTLEEGILQLLFQTAKTRDFTLLSLKEAPTIYAHDFIQAIFHGDDLKGFLFFNPYLKTFHRTDDTIDYYEHTGSPTFKIQYLKKPIYPYSSYIQVNNPNPSDIHTTHPLSNQYLQKLAYPTHNTQKQYHPTIPECTYQLAQLLNIIPPDTQYNTFAVALEPAIITYWA